MMRKKLLLLGIIAVTFLMGGVKAHALPIENPDACSIDFSFSPNSGTYGTVIQRSWSSDNVKHLSGTCTDVNPDGTKTTNNFDSLPLDYTDSFTVSQNVDSTHCTLSGRSGTGATCSASIDFTVLRPSCTASTPAWSPAGPVDYNGSATLNWSPVDFINMGDSNSVTKLDCGAAEIDVTGQTSHNFSSLSSKTTCAVKGYINDVLSCTSPSATISVNAPPPAKGQINVSIAGGLGLSWRVAGSGYGHDGAGSDTLSDVPGGSYALGITGGWNWNVVTSIEAPFGNVITLPPPVVPGQVTPPSTCQDQNATNYGGSLPCTYPSPPGPGHGGLPDIPHPKQPEQNIFLQFDPLRFLSGLTHKALAQAYITSISFQVNHRAAQNNKGAFRVNDITTDMFPNSSITVSGSADDSADGFKTLDLYKTFRRLSDGTVVSNSKVADAWNGILTDQNGAWSTNSKFQCDGRDGAPFTDSDYQDSSFVLYDQGDHTGDTSPSIALTKYCGGSFVLQSVDDKGNPIPIGWSAQGPYSAWNDSQSRVTYYAQSGSYGMRLDQGSYDLSLSAPSGYKLNSVEFVVSKRRAVFSPIVNTALAYTSPVPGCTGPASGTTVCPLAIAQANEQTIVQVTWSSNVGTTIPITCSQITPNPVAVGQQVNFSAQGNTLNYSWSAPGGSPSSQSGTNFNFSTSFSSAGQKTVTVTGGGSSSNCSVDIIQNSPPLPTLVIDPSSNSATTCTNANFVAWYDPDGPGGSQPQQNVSALATWSSNDQTVAQSQGGGIFKGLKVGGTGIGAIYSGITATAFLNVGSGSCPNPTPDFSCVVSPGSVTVPQGGSGRGNVTCSPTDGFASPITFSSQNVPSATTQNYSPNPITIPTASQYTFSAGQTSVPGAYTLMVVAQGGGISHQYPLNVTITGTNNPQTCNDPAATNFGGSLPCTYPPGICTDPTATNFGGSLPCKYPGGGICNDPTATNFGGPLPCKYAGGGNPHYSCVNNTCARVDTQGPNTDGCTANNLGASCVPIIQPPGSCTFSASPSLISPGGSSLLSWSNCGNVCSISGVGGGFSGTGSARVNPVTPTTYTLSCDNGAAIKTAKVSIFGLQEQVPQ